MAGKLFQLRNNDYELRQLIIMNYDGSSHNLIYQMLEDFLWRRKYFISWPKNFNIVSNKIKEETSLDAFRKLTKDDNLKTVHVDYLNKTLKCRFYLKFLAIACCCCFFM